MRFIARGICRWRWCDWPSAGRRWGGTIRRAGSFTGSWGERNSLTTIAPRRPRSEAYRKAFEADPVSAFVGVIGINRPVDEETATEIAKTFVEWIAAPGYSQQALAILGATEVVAAD